MNTAGNAVPALLSIVETLELLKTQIELAIAGARLEIVPNESPSGQCSLLVDRDHGFAVARFLRDDRSLQYDYASNVTGVDWPDAELSEKIKVKKVVDGVEKEVEEVRKTFRPGYLEVVYHLYSTALKHGPLVLRLRTPDRTDVRLPSLTPIWRGAELQEREVFDLFGVLFEGHPDLRRILMWDEFKDYPMRKDYVEPDDYEYEPTPHDDVADRVKARVAKEAP